MNKTKEGNNDFLKRPGNNSQPDFSNENNLEFQADNILAVLNEDVDIPEGLVEKVLQKTEAVNVDKPSGFDFHKYLQIAAVFAAAVLLGVLLGRNADVHAFNKKQSIEKQALLEFRQKHHLTDNYSFGRF